MSNGPEWRRKGAKAVEDSQSPDRLDARLSASASRPKCSAHNSTGIASFSAISLLASGLAYAEEEKVRTFPAGRPGIARNGAAGIAFRISGAWRQRGP